MNQKKKAFYAQFIFRKKLNLSDLPESILESIELHKKKFPKGFDGSNEWLESDDAIKKDLEDWWLTDEEDDDDQGQNQIVIETTTVTPNKEVEFEEPAIEAPSKKEITNEDCLSLLYESGLKTVTGRQLQIAGYQGPLPIFKTFKFGIRSLNYSFLSGKYEIQ